MHDPRCPRIPPAVASEARPFWSVMIPHYNRTQFLERTLRSVLAQDAGAKDMQIEVVDDSSCTDDPEPEVRRIAGNRVTFYRQPQRLGVPGNWNSCVERSRGHWVHILHSDDFVLPGFYERLRQALCSRDDLGAAFCRHMFVDQAGFQRALSPLERQTAGTLPGFLESIGVSQRVQCAAMVVRRRVYEKLGGFRAELRYTPDWEMWTRIAAEYPIWYEPSPLAAFCIHSQSYTAQLAQLGRQVPDMRRCIEICRPYLPPHRAAAISSRARNEAALWALEQAGAAVRDGRYAAALRYAREGLRTSSSLRVCTALLAETASLAKGGFRRAYRIVRRKGRLHRKLRDPAPNEK